MFLCHLGLFLIILFILFLFFQPENIFLQRENHVKIGDFGLAKGCMAEEDEEAQSNAVSSGMPKHIY